MAIVSEPKVLLADEPASGLSATQRTVLASMPSPRSARTGAVVVVGEHDLDMLTSISGHMWAMVEKRLAYWATSRPSGSSPVYVACRAYEQGLEPPAARRAASARKRLRHHS